MEDKYALHNKYRGKEAELKELVYPAWEFLCDLCDELEEEKPVNTGDPLCNPAAYCKELDYKLYAMRLFFKNIMDIIYY